jgi:hypothetical protein
MSFSVRSSEVTVYQGIYGLPPTRNSVMLPTAVYSVSSAELLKISRNYAEFRVTELDKIPRNSVILVCINSAHFQLHEDTHVHYSYVFHFSLYLFKGIVSGDFLCLFFSKNNSSWSHKTL